MAYQVSYTESNNPAKPAITVQDQSLNNQTSLTFVGKNYSGYGPIIAGNFLHLLENFANTTAPGSPVQGQLWYDTSTNILKVYDGTNWTSSGSLKKASNAPDVAGSLLGDLWVDTANSQLYLFSGSTWLLVGPQYSQGALTGPVVENIVDTENIVHSVITMYSTNASTGSSYPVSIISKDTFTPKLSIEGFTSIKEGVNLSSLNASTGEARFWGTASSSDSLLINNKEVSSSNFLRSDTTSTTNYPFSIRSDAGLSVGSDLSFNIGTNINTGSTVFLSKNSGNTVDFRFSTGGGNTGSALYLDSAGQIGLGNNTFPQSTLDVSGLITVSDGLNVTGTTNSTALTVGSIKTAGGLSVALDSNFGGTITSYGNILINNLSGGNPVAGPVILPGSDSATALYDIGSSTRKFRNIYAQSFVGTFNGAFTGSLAGNVNGSAAKLASPTAFSLTGEVISNVVSFDGQSTTGTAVFTTSISPTFITTLGSGAPRPTASDSQSTDSMLVYRAGTGMLNMTKQTFLNHVPTVPVGAIFPYAGSTAPTGYLLCDGSEVKISSYPQLYATIGYAYKAVSLLQGLSTFALPDLRGRFPLGRDNMNNNLTVPYKDGSGTQVSAGGGAANRVTDSTADILGAGSGTQQVSLATANLPNHIHDLNSGNAQYYAAGLPNAGSDPNAIAGLGLPTSSTGSGLPNSGGVKNYTTQTPVNVMNPYETINYIIFTGVL